MVGLGCSTALFLLCVGGRGVVLSTFYDRYVWSAFVVIFYARELELYGIGLEASYLDFFSGRVW